MSEPFTVVYRGLTSEQRSLITLDPKAVWFGHCHAPHERDEARAAVEAAQPEAVGLIRAMLHNAMDRMDRARNLLTDGNPRPECNWGMLDTSDLRKALASAPTEPMSAPNAPAKAEPDKWIDDPHDIEQGRIMNPKWVAWNDERIDKERRAATPPTAASDATPPATAAGPSDAERLDWAADAQGWGNALNSASWEFDESYRRHMGEPTSAKLFNHAKLIVRDAILKYAERVAAIRATKGGKL